MIHIACWPPSTVSSYPTAKACFGSVSIVRIRDSEDLAALAASVASKPGSLAIQVGPGVYALSQRRPAPRP
jgi:hypothetical protein